MLVIREKFYLIKKYPDGHPIKVGCINKQIKLGAIAKTNFINGLNKTFVYFKNAIKKIIQIL